MTEDDTFNVLKTWPFDQVCQRLDECKNREEVVELLNRAGWTQEEYVKAFSIWWKSKI